MNDRPEHLCSAKVRTRRPVSVVGFALLGLAVCLWLGGSVSAAELPPGDTTFASQLHADDRTYFVLEDPVPHLRAFLTHPVVRHAGAQGALADWLKKQNWPEPLEIWNFLDDHRRWIPAQVAVGISEAGIGDLDHLARSIAMYQLIEAADTHRPGDNPPLAAELKTLRLAFLVELKQAQLPRLRLIARFRAEQEAADIVGWFKSHINDTDPKEIPDGLKFEQPDSGIVARFSLSDALGDDEQAARLLTMLHLADPDDAAFTGQLIAAARQIKAEASLKRTGSVLTLTLGPADAGGAAGLPAKLLSLPAAVGNADIDTIAWGRWDFRRLRDGIRGWAQLKEQWAKSNAYALVAESDRSEHPLVDDLHLLAGWLGRVSLTGGAPLTGAARLWVDHERAGAVRLSMQTEPLPIAAEAASLPAAKFIPADAEGYFADATLGLGEFLPSIAGQLEDHFAADLFLPAEHPNAITSPRLMSGYYAHFGPMRELLHKGLASQFEPGVVCVVGTQSRLQRVEAAFELHGKSQRWSGRDLPAVEIALVGQPKAPADPAVTKKLIEELFAASTTGLRSAFRPQPDDRPLPAVAATAQPIDLGLGIPTWGFTGDALTAATGEAKLRVAIEGEIRPHFFLVDNCVVVSTSARLSKTLLAARDGKTPRALLAGPANEGKVVTAAKAPGATIGTLADHAASWYTMIADNLDRAANSPIPAEELTRVESMLGLLSQAGKLADRVEWRIVQTPGGPARVTHGGIYFLPEK